MRVISAERSQPFGNVFLGKPFHFFGSRFFLDGFKALGAYKLDCPGTVFSYVRDQSKDALGGYLEAPSPILKNSIVLGQQAQRKASMRAWVCSAEPNGMERDKG